MKLRQKLASKRNPLYIVRQIYMQKLADVVTEVAL